MMPSVPAIVFTDLDGTLLDHHSYSYSAATPALNALKSNDIPVILASSKTAAEIAPLRAELGLAAYPAIVENGAGLLPSHTGPEVPANSDYDKIRAALDDLPSTIRRYFKGFGDISNAQVAAQTGLPLPAAIQAKTRAFSEPGLWSGPEDALAQFLAALDHHGIHARHGGRYLTLSFGKTKADQMTNICQTFDNPPIIALGDAPNDLEMLLAADYPILIHNPEAKPLSGLTPDDQARLLRSTLPGPQGWNEMILPIIDTLTSPTTGA